MPMQCKMCHPAQDGSDCAKCMAVKPTVIQQHQESVWEDNHFGELEPQGSITPSGNLGGMGGTLSKHWW